eukprot:4864080-Amphidinium_carterae.1
MNFFGCSLQVAMVSPFVHLCEYMVHILPEVYGRLGRFPMGALKEPHRPIVMTTTNRLLPLEAHSVGRSQIFWVDLMGKNKTVSS